MRHADQGFIIRSIKKTERSEDTTVMVAASPCQSSPAEQVFECVWTIENPETTALVLANLVPRLGIADLDKIKAWSAEQSPSLNLLNLWLKLAEAKQVPVQQLIPRFSDFFVQLSRNR